MKTSVEQRKAEAQTAMVVCCEQCGSTRTERRDSLGNYFCSTTCLNAYHGIGAVTTYWSQTLGRRVTIPE